mmetsp:Transcript_61645/g.149245  ORF Transcript_61645/g.149245 Transcript_61645/m.149245 type:complete len:147 (+) Transcript_61645:192-632(+)
MAHGGAGGMSHQDWEPVVMVKRHRKGPAPSRGGTADERTGRKFTGGTNKSGRGAGASARKLEEESDDFRHASIGLDLKKALMQARTAKGWKQKDLAHRINEKAATVALYENGKAIPNHVVIGKMERALGVKLPRPVKPKRVKGDDD